MKLYIFLAILVVLASSQCPGFKSDVACFNSATAGYGWGKIDQCNVYAGDPPNTCSACFLGYSGTTCGTAGYTHFTKFPITGDEDKKCWSYDTDPTFDYVALNYAWDKYSCIDANKQMICNCLPGYVFQPAAATYGTCAQCTVTGCVACEVKDATKCTQCSPNYFLEAAGCTKCHDKALTCATKALAASCMPGYYLDNGLCTQCTDVNSYCKVKDTIDSCKPTFYHDTTAKQCKSCGSSVYTCTSVPVTNSDSGITECVPPDANNVYYKVTTKGCFGVATSKKCKTVNASGNCISCFTGYYNNVGQCQLCSSRWTGLRSGQYLWTDAISSCTGGSDTVAYTIACKDGYYALTQQCMPCDARCDKCAGGDGTNATTGATECTKIAAGFTKLSTAIVACDDSGIATHTSCKTCNDGVSPANNNCLTTVAGSGYAVLASDGQTYVCGTAAKCTECTLQTSTTFACTAIAVGFYVEKTTGALNSELKVCGTGMATCTGTTGALGTCTETGFVKQTTTEAPIAITCEAEGTVNKYVNCAEGTYTATGTVKACTRCDSRYKLVSGDCVQCHASEYHFTNALGTGCVKYVDNCYDRTATYNTLESDVAKCSKCAAGFVPKSNNTVCYDCTGITGYANRYSNAKLAIKTSDDGCQITQCSGSSVAGYSYYVKDGTCIAEPLSNCYVQTVTDGTTVACMICNFGYKWDTVTTACKQCDQTNFKCATTGCASLDYPNKPGAGGSTSGSDVALLQVVFALLLSIFTLLI